MNNSADLNEQKLVKSQVLSCFWIFIFPVLTLLFFYHAESSYDEQWSSAMVEAINMESSFGVDEREQLVQQFKDLSFSDALRDNGKANGMESMIPEETTFHYKIFRWMIWLCWIAIGSAVLVLLMAGIAVKVSMTSRKAQYFCLSSGFAILRVFATTQVLMQGVMITALSFWVTALWFEVYFVKLVGIIGIISVIAAWSIIKAIFTKMDDRFEIVGKSLSKEDAPWFWQKVEDVCSDLGTEAPKQIIAGIDDNFFVTESNLHVESEIYSGRTLFVSFSLLKQLSEDETEAVVAHEMAHFSGNDTFYSQKIALVLKKHAIYLHALREGIMSMPVFSFMLAFRSLFELSLGKESREREFRADRIAAERVSSLAVANALIKINSYSSYRNEVEMMLFENMKTIETANIQEQVEEGFKKYLSEVNHEALDDSQTTHPFDSHPPLADRFEALGVSVDAAMKELKLSEGEGKWFTEIVGANALEGEQWQKYETMFSEVHEESLIYQYMPSNEEEAAFLAKRFPEEVRHGKKPEMDLVIDYEKISIGSWGETILFSEISDLAYYESSLSGDKLGIKLKAGGKEKKVSVSKYNCSKEEIVDLINRYGSRYFSAVEYARVKAFRDEMETEE